MKINRKDGEILGRQYDRLYDTIEPIGLSVPVLRNVVRVHLPSDFWEGKTRLLIQKSDETVTIVRQDEAPLQVSIDSFSMRETPNGDRRVFHEPVPGLVLRRTEDGWLPPDESILADERRFIAFIGTLGQYAIGKQERLRQGL